MSYGKVYEEYWDGEKIAALSDRAALLGLFLITGPHRNAIGCFRIGTGAISDIPRFGAWGIEGVCEALSDMSRTGFIVRDDTSGWTLIVNALRKDPIRSAKVAIHALMLANRVPKNTNVYKGLTELLELQLGDFSDTLSDREGWPMADPIDTPSIPLRSPSPLTTNLKPEPEPQTSAPSPARSMMEIWNEVCVPAVLAKAVKLHDTRRKQLALRLKEDFGNDLEQWRAYCQRIAASEFLTGRVAPGPNRDKPFKADIDWVLTPANLAKIVEGNYGGQPNGANGQDTGPYLGEHNDDLRTDYRRLMRWQDDREWMDHWGPKPGEPDCKIAAEVMAKYGQAAP